MPIKTSDQPFTTRLKESEADKFMQRAVAKAQDAQWDKRTASREDLGNWPEWRELGEQIRQHVIRYLPDYLERFGDNVEARGGHVFFASTDEEASAYIQKKLRSISTPIISSKVNRWSPLKSTSIKSSSNSLIERSLNLTSLNSFCKKTILMNPLTLCFPPCIKIATRSKPFLKKNRLYRLQ